jgi:tripartite-type tricarboxylate transporter receptor subunit TctC
MKRLIVVSLGIILIISLVFHEDEIRASEKYPAKPITAIIPGEAGSGGDVLARPLLEKASALLRTPIMVVNKPGAGQTIGYREIYQAKPDGYTIGCGYLTLITSKLQGRFPYDYRDFTLIGHHVAVSPIIVASTKTKRPFKTIQEVISFAKTHPSEISLATTAVGGPYWTAVMLIEEATGLQFNLIPQEGSGAFVTAQVAGGHTDLGVTEVSSAKPQIEAGNIVPLAVIGPQRLSGELGHVPTWKEVGYDISLTSFVSIIAPPKMQKEVTEILVRTIKTAATDPEYQKFIRFRSDTPLYMGPEEFFNFCEDQRKVYRRIFEKAGLLKEK